jgi:hypothetical protein
MKKTVVICSSGSHYQKIFSIQKDLQAMGYKVVLPSTAIKMKKKNDFNIDTYKTWFENPKDYRKKRIFMDRHFKKIINGDLVLIANFDKNGIEGYIGGNVLMEITIAYYHKKPIYILNNISEASSIKEEIYGVDPIFLSGKLSLLKS